MINSHHCVGLQLNIVKDQLILSIPSGHVNLNDMYIQVWLRVKLGFTLAASIVTTLGWDVRLMMTLMNLKLLPLKIKLATSINLRLKKLISDIIFNVQLILSIKIIILMEYKVSIL
jgi:hypothetical protein